MIRGRIYSLLLVGQHIIRPSLILDAAPDGSMMLMKQALPAWRLHIAVAAVSTPCSSGGRLHGCKPYPTVASHILKACTPTPAYVLYIFPKPHPLLNTLSLSPDLCALPGLQGRKAYLEKRAPDFSKFKRLP